MEFHKAKRGTKRVCPECGTPFYDLLRDTIPCPSCGVNFVAAMRPDVESTTITSTHAFNTGWRSKPYKRPEPVKQPEPAIASQTSADDEPIDSAMEETSGPEPQNDAVLEHEPDDADDLFNLIDHSDNEHKEH
jgi:uncharacterized protein (TIGR02300 family)